MQRQYNWAMIGCGLIAKDFAKAMIDHDHRIYSLANRSKKRAEEFAQQYGIKRVYEHVDDAFLDDKVDIVYIATPHNTHLEYIKKALNSGKHVLCEKAITLNSNELCEVCSLAKEKGLVLAEAMTIYHMPIFKELEELVKSEKLGKVNMITVNFGSYRKYEMGNRYYSRKLGGGAMLDIGIYALSFLRLFMRMNPEDILTQVEFAPTMVDEMSTILFRNRDRQMATVALTLNSKQPKRGTVSCDKGYFELMEYPRADRASITYTDTLQTELLESGSFDDALWYEIFDMERAIEGKCDMRLDLTKDVMELITTIMKKWNMSFT